MYMLQLQREHALVVMMRMRAELAAGKIRAGRLREARMGASAQNAEND